MGGEVSKDAAPGGVPVDEQVGYEVLRVQADSPAAGSGGLRAFDDWVVAANGCRLDRDNAVFSEWRPVYCGAPVLRHCAPRGAHR